MTTIPDTEPIHVDDAPRDFPAVLNQWTDELLKENQTATSVETICLITRLGALGQRLTLRLAEASPVSGALRFELPDSPKGAGRMPRPRDDRGGRRMQGKRGRPGNIRHQGRKR